MPTKKRGDAGEFAKLACGEYNTIVVAGGDGTLNEVVNAISTFENRPKIGYIPMGTTNDFAHSLKIPKNIKKAVKIILDGKTVKNDVFKINDRFGVYVCAFGIFTASSYTAKQGAKKRFGKLAYYLSGIKEIKHANKFKVVLKTGDVVLEQNVILGIIANSRYVSGYKINKMACHWDGCVDLVLFKERKKRGVSLRMLLKIFSLFLFGITTLKNSKDVIILKLSECSIEMDENISVNVDGEKGLCGSFNLKVLKQHMEIFVKG